MFNYFQLRGETIVSASCNYGTSALVTGKGHLYMFGKDACYCDSNGRLNLPNEHVTQVSIKFLQEISNSNFFIN